MEEAYVHWAGLWIWIHGNPRQTTIGGPEVGRFLAAQVGEQNVSASKQRHTAGFLFVQQALLEQQADPFGFDPAGPRAFANAVSADCDYGVKEYWVAGS
jgi:hypothetical protein